MERCFCSGTLKGWPLQKKLFKWCFLPRRREGYALSSRRGELENSILPFKSWKCRDTIKADREIVFDLSRSIDLHRISVVQRFEIGTSNLWNIAPSEISYLHCVFNRKFEKYNWKVKRSALTAHTIYGRIVIYLKCELQCGYLQHPENNLDDNQ